jgi:hydroxypyruvate isomerase
MNGRVNHSITSWCFEEYWDIPKQCEIAKQLGCKSVELVQPEHFPTLKENGLVNALAHSHWFDAGMNNPDHHAMCIEKMRDAIDLCAEYDFPNVITFTGPADGLSLDDGLKNCVEGYKQIVGHAEKKGVTLCLEMLNSRVEIEMQGHPGYQGDHTDYVMDIVKAVGSPRLQLLFDMYHVQIMDGDIISRIRQYKDYIGHYHTAGNPGRGPIGDSQEINYKPILEAIVESGYTGYVGHEFLPSGDPMDDLREAITICDV